MCGAALEIGVDLASLSACSLCKVNRVCRQRYLRISVSCGKEVHIIEKKRCKVDFCSRPNIKDKERSKNLQTEIN